MSHAPRRVHDGGLADSERRMSLPRREKTRHDSFGSPNVGEACDDFADTEREPRRTRLASPALSRKGFSLLLVCSGEVLPLWSFRGGSYVPSMTRMRPAVTATMRRMWGGRGLRNRGIRHAIGLSSVVPPLARSWTIPTAKDSQDELL